MLRRSEIQMLGVFVLALTTPFAGAQGNDPYALNLQARQFVPPAGLSAARAATEDRHLILQFHGAITEADLAALRTLGVTVLGPVPRRAVIASVPANTSLTELDGLRWAGPLAPSDKVDRRTHRALSDHRYVVVDFHLDVPRDAIRATLDLAGAELHPRDAFPDTTVLARVPDTASLERLAAQDEVAFMFAASPDMIADHRLTYCPGPVGPLGRLQNFVAGDDGWDGAGNGSAVLTYNFTNGTPDLPGTDEEPIIVDGIVEWGDVVDLTFSPTATADANNSLQILFGTGDHSGISGFDETGAEFDGPFGVLAHAYFPGGSETIRGDIHFDEDEDWTMTDSFDLFSVALHEAGHAHGLAHSFEPDAVMWPTASVFPRLHPDDIMGVQSIYAIPNGVDIYTPDGGEDLIAGETETLVWVGGSDAGATVTVNLYKDGVLQGPIASGTENDGFLDWAIPPEIGTSSGYTIEVISDSNGALAATSEAPFSISQIERTTYPSSDVPDTIPNNGAGQNFGMFSSVTVANSGTLLDIQLTNIGIDYEDLGDLQFFMLVPGSNAFNFFNAPGHCSATPIVSTAPFGFDDQATAAFGDDCPPLADTFYQPDLSLRAFTQGIDPNGTWQLVISDSDATDPAGQDGTLTSWSLVIGTATPDPGQFSPVFLDGAAVSPGAGTEGLPYTILEPARAAVTAGGEIRVAAGTYSVGATTFTEAVTLSVDPNNPGTVRFE